jgi:hypothetical protein
MGPVHNFVQYLHAGLLSGCGSRSELNELSARDGGITSGVTIIASGHEPGTDSWSAVCSLAVDDSRVFFATSQKILSAPK